jgi:hypothetical protein
MHDADLGGREPPANGVASWRALRGLGVLLHAGGVDRWLRPLAQRPRPKVNFAVHSSVPTYRLPGQGSVTSHQLAPASPQMITFPTTRSVSRSALATLHHTTDIFTEGGLYAV